MLAEGNESIAQRLPGFLADGLRFCCSEWPVGSMRLAAGGRLCKEKKVGGKSRYVDRRRA